MPYKRPLMLGSALVAVAVGVAAVILISGDQAGGGRQKPSGSDGVQRPQRCRVTVPNGSTPPGEKPSAQHHGNDSLWTTLGRKGRFTVARESAPEYLGPNGEIAVDGILAADGSVGIKAPWWRGRGVRGRLRLRARRLDAPAPRVDRTIPPAGYGLTGFQAVGLILPTIGCWKVTGVVEQARLSYVTLVRKAHPSPTP